jgi:hypothetical protein
LPAATRQAALTAQVAVGDGDDVLRTDGYGYGWYVGTVAGGHRVFYHPGDNPGYLAFNAWFPDDDVFLVALSNDEASPLERVVRDLIDRAFPSGA